MIRKKLRSRRGFSLSELLVVLAIMSLVGMAIGVGISTAGKAYDEITMNSEASALCGTLAVELSDELRFAGHIAGGGDTFTYASARFGANAGVGTDAAGHVTIGGRQLLSEAAYMGLAADVNARYEAGYFLVKITVLKGERALSAAALSIVPIN